MRLAWYFFFSPLLSGRVKEPCQPLFFLLWPKFLWDGCGKDFAARNAECVFVAAPSKKVLKEYVRDIRQRAAGFGRDPASLLFFNLFTVIVAPTESEAKAKHDEYRN
jgi:hypothetical protein